LSGSDKLIRWGFLCLALWLCFFLNLGGATLFDTEEGRFSAASLTLLQSGDPLKAFIDGNFILTAAPLAHWFQAYSLTVFGQTEFALRLPTAIAASLWILAVYQFVSARMGSMTGCYAVAFMGCSLAVVLIGRSATEDALFNLLLTLSLLDLYRWCEGERRRHLFKAFIWIGLGLLCTGLLAVLIPVAVVSVYLLSNKRVGDLVRTALYWPGWLALLAIAVPWYAYQYELHGNHFLHTFFLEGFWYEFTQNYSSNSSPLYYLYTLPLIVVPFSSLAMVALWRAGQAWDTPLARYLLCWFAVVLVSFSAGAKMLPNYLLYGSPALFILMAIFRSEYKGRLLTLLPLILFAMICASLPLVFKYYNPAGRLFDTEIIAVGKTVLFHDSYWAPALLFLVLSIWLLLSKRLQTAEALALGGFIQTAFVAATLGSAVGLIQQGAVKQAALKAKEADVELVMWETDKPSMAFYRQQPVAVLNKTTTALGESLSKGQWVFAPIHKMEGLPPVAEKYRHGGYVLAEVLEDASLVDAVE